MAYGIKDEMWVFPIVDGKHGLVVVPRPLNVVDLLRALGLASSNKEAHRFLAAKAIHQREWEGYDTWHVPDSLVEGHPQVIRRSKRIQAVYMLPISGQTQECWLELLNE
jgi:hypothetical protein